MFRGAPFNQDISSWNVSNVTNMNQMFQNASSFNQNIRSWDVSSVTTMRYMFNGAAAFNQDISAWNPAITDMDGMFANASAFDQNLNGWDVSLIPSIPFQFANNATLFTTDEHPIWGTTGTPQYLVDGTYGDLVAYYNIYGYNNASGYELNAYASRHILGATGSTFENRYAVDADFAAKLAAGTTITYVFTGNFTTYVQRYAIADLLTCNVKPIDNTTIGPSAFDGASNTLGWNTHWHQETSGNTISGSDYSFLHLHGGTSYPSYNFGWDHNHGVAPLSTSGVNSPVTQSQGATGSPRVAIYIV
jgi:surface protein